MKHALVVSLALALIGCSEEEPIPTTESAATEPGPSGTVFSTAPAPKCAYAGGCEGIVKPSSGRLTVDGKACAIDSMTLDMDPLCPDPAENGCNIQNLEWQLEAVSSACDLTLRVEGAHFERYPQKRSDASLSRGPVNHTPRAIEGATSVDARAVTFTFFFGDENGAQN